MTKIKVDADLTSFESELNKVKQSVAKINAALQGGGNVSGSAASKELDALIKRADKLTATIEKLNKAGAINSKQAGDAAKHFDTMARAAARLEKHADVKEAWASSWLRESAGEQRIRQQLIRSQPAQSGFNNKLVGGASAIAGSLIGGGNVGSSFGAMAGGLVGRLGGPVGTIIGSAIGGALGGRSSSGLSDAKQTAITFSDTRHSLGALTTDFSTLRDTVQNLVGGLGIAHSEAANLAKQFVKTANVTSEQFGDIGESLKTSVGFGRGYGLDPSQSAGFFGTMRQFGVTKNDTDNRRLALMIGESVARGGNNAKMAEVLSSVGNYVSIATRRSLSDVNAGGYLSILNSMTGTGIAGLKNDPSNAAAIIGQADQAFRQGGALGEGSRNFLLHALSKSNPNMTAMDLDLLLGQGLFGSSSKAFGRDSAAFTAADAYGDERLKAHYSNLAGNDQINLSTVMRELERESGGSAEMMMKSLKGVLGMTDEGAAAFYTAYKNDPGMGNLQKVLAGAGIGPEGLNAKAVGSLADIAGASPERLDQIWMGLMNKASDKDIKGVESVLSEHGAGSEQFRDAILRLSNKIDNTDPGDQSRKLQADLNNSIQGLTENFVGVGKELIGVMTDLNAMFKPLIGWLAGKFGFADELIGDTKTKVSEGIGSLSKKIGQSALSGGSTSGDTGDIGARLMSDLMRDHGLTKEQAAGVVGNLMHESAGFKKMQEVNPRGGRGGYGYAQWTGSRRKQFEAWAAQKGLSVDSYEANYGFLNHELMGSENRALRALKQTSSIPEATKVFHDTFERSGIPRMDSRIRNAHAALRLSGDEMPAEQRRKESDKGMSFNASFNGDFRLRDSTGSEIAEPLLMTWGHSPRPAGAN